MIHTLSEKGRALLSILLAAAMVIGLMPVMAMPVYGEETHSHDSAVSDYSTLQGYIDNNATVNAYLTADISLGSNYVTVPYGKTLNLCLNGYSLCSSSSYTIDVKGTLNIYDCGTNEHYYAISQGKAVLSSELTDVSGKTEGQDYIKINGGYISNSPRYGYGIYLGWYDSDPVVNMYGGNIIGISGCAVDMQAGKFNFYGGTLQGNTATAGSAVNVNYANSGTMSEFNMYGGEIIYNTSTSYYSTYGGAVCNQNNCTVNLNGKCVINDNYYIDSWDYLRYHQANYYGASGSTMKITGAITGSAIGVGLENKTGTALAALVSQANGNVSFSLSTGATAAADMNSAQAAVAKTMKDPVIISTSIFSNGKDIGENLGGGMMEITVPVSASDIRVFRMDNAGPLYAVHAEVIDGVAFFHVEANCIFVIEQLGDEGSETVEFTDVPADAYYADAVAWASQNGITTGTSATTFSPNDKCSRANIVTFLYRDLAK